ncbi:MAG: phytanoyl-CoA dioxygenase family protein [Armatimonadetes bacterium]|nr:phytanoyl-CoA dioxygenase family protein [Armatimonadota bacterium]
MSLTDAQIAQWREEGYCLVAEFWPAREVAGMRAELARLVRDGLLRNVATVGDGKTHSDEVQNLQICPIWPKSDFFRAMPFAPKVAETVRLLVGDPVLFHLDQIFLKPARLGSGTNWHQDNAYFKIDDPLGGTAMWTAIHDATVENGTMHIIPGSWREKYPHERDGHSDHHIRCWPDESRAVPAILPAGGVLLFAYGTAHCTRDNRSDGERAGCAHHFVNQAWNHQTPNAATDKYRPPLTGPHPSAGETEFGVKVAGTWEAQIDRVLAGG